MQRIHFLGSSKGALFTFRHHGVLPTKRKITLRSVCQQVTFTWADGKKETMPRATALVGREEAADMRLSSDQVEAEHAKLELKGGRLFCTALTGDADDFFSPTRTWLNGGELRPGVAYMVAPGAVLAFGTPENTMTVEFTEQGGSSAMADMLMKGMASQASPEVKQQLDSI